MPIGLRGWACKMPNPDNDALRHFAKGGFVDPDEFNLYPRSDALHQLLMQRILRDPTRHVVTSGPNAPSNRLKPHIDIEVLANNRPGWVPKTDRFSITWQTSLNDVEARVIASMEDPIGDLRKRELRGDLVTMLARLREQKQRGIETEQDRLLRLTAHLPDAWI